MQAGEHASDRDARTRKCLDFSGFLMLKIGGLTPG